MAPHPTIDRPSAAAMAAEVAQAQREADALGTLFPQGLRVSEEVRERDNQLCVLKVDRTDEIIASPVDSFADALAVLLATGCDLFAAVENGDGKPDIFVPYGLAIQRATDFLASYMETGLDDLGARYFRDGQQLWDRGQGIRAHWWVDRALSRGFAFNVRSDGSVVICAPMRDDVAGLTGELAALDRGCLDHHVRFLVAEQRDPARCDMDALADRDWWLTSRAVPAVARADLRVVEGSIDERGAA